jgi:hypothetical protein
MGRIKYDWDKIKQQYLKSDIMDVRTFLREEIKMPDNIIIAGATNAKIAGWRGEKIRERAQAAELARQERIQLLKEKYRVNEKKLLKAKKDLLEALFAKIKNSVKVGKDGKKYIKLNAYAFESFLRIIDNELNEYGLTENNSKFFSNVQIILNEIDPKKAAEEK